MFHRPDRRSVDLIQFVYIVKDVAKLAGDDIEFPRNQGDSGQIVDVLDLLQGLADKGYIKG